MKSIRGRPAMGGRIGQRLDDFHLLDDRAGPAMRDDDRQRIFMPGTNVNEMNVETIDLSDEVRYGSQFRLALAPVVVCFPIAREILHRASCTPCDASATCSRSGHLVALTRRRRSSRSASGKLN